MGIISKHKNLADPKLTFNGSVFFFKENLLYIRDAQTRICLFIRYYKRNDKMPLKHNLISYIYTKKVVKNYIYIYLTKIYLFLHWNIINNKWIWLKNNYLTHFNIIIRDERVQHYLYLLTIWIICICTRTGRGLTRKRAGFNLEVGRVVLKWAGL